MNQLFIDMALLFGSFVAVAFVINRYKLIKRNTGQSIDGPVVLIVYLLAKVSPGRLEKIIFWRARYDSMDIAIAQGWKRSKILQRQMDAFIASLEEDAYPMNLGVTFDALPAHLFKGDALLPISNNIYEPVVRKWAIQDVLLTDEHMTSAV